MRITSALVDIQTFRKRLFLFWQTIFNYTTTNERNYTKLIFMKIVAFNHICILTVKRKYWRSTLTKNNLLCQHFCRLFYYFVSSKCQIKASELQSIYYQRLSTTQFQLGCCNLPVLSLVIQSCLLCSHGGVLL